MVNVAILCLMMLSSSVIHLCHCLPTQENDVKIEAELKHLLRRFEEINNDQYSRKKGSRMAGQLPLTSDKQAAVVNLDDGSEVKKVVEEAKNTLTCEPELRHCHNENETEFWGYVDVRPGAHMFYWLYHSCHPHGYLSRPLIIWLQGGPGESSCGYGNFELIGPRGLNFTRRRTSWVRQANVLFLDNPVGAGFSYVDESVGSLTTNTDEITDDLMSFTRQFIDRFPQFTQIPIYVFGESYGGKMAAHFANRLYKEAAAGRISVHVVGFSMGNSWISPGEQTMSYGPMLYQLSLIDDTELETIQSTAALTKERVAAGQYQEAIQTFAETMNLVGIYTNNVDSYNFLVFNKHLTTDKRAVLENGYSPIFATQDSPELPDFMNGPVRQALGIIPSEVTWLPVNPDVYVALPDIMSSTVHVVDDALWNTTLQVIIMEGQLDVICNTAGVMRWIQTLSWPGLYGYNSAKRQTLINPDTELTEAFVKAHDRLKFYWILGAGHSVAKDSGEATYRVLQRILDNVDV